MRIKAAFVFFVTAVLYGLTLATSSYVGVYLSYVALPILLISGYIMLFGGRQAKPAPKSASLFVESMDAVSGLLGDFNDAMDGLNDDLARTNRKNELKRQRTEKERAAEKELRLRRVEWDAHLRYANSDDDRARARQELAAIDAQLATLRAAMMAIEKQCEIDAIQEQRARLSKT
jgi:hypothetical protein